MLKLSLLLVAFLAIKNVELTEVQQAPVQAPIDSAAASQLIGNLPSVERIAETVRSEGSIRKSKSYYPIDLIAKAKGCVPLTTLGAAGNLVTWNEPSNKMTHQACWKKCFKSGSSYAAVAKGNDCLCTNATIPMSATFGTSNTPCTGHSFQTCGSSDCADYFILKMSEDTLRHSLRNLEADNIWVHKSDSKTWSRYKDESFEFSLHEVIPTSNAVINVYDCDSQNPRPANCQNFYAVLNGFEDFLATCPQRGALSITPIDVEWDIVFALRKTCHADPDVVLFRKSLCQWVLKVDEVVKEEFSYLNFEFDTRTLVLVDKSNQNRIIKVAPGNSGSSSSSYTVYENGLPSATFTGKWFNDAQYFKNYFRGLYTCSNQLTNRWYQAPVSTRVY